MAKNRKLFGRFNAFLTRAPAIDEREDRGQSAVIIETHRSVRSFSSIDRSITSAVKNRIALDFASQKFEHVLTDDEGNYQETVDSYLNYCLTLESNIDQVPQALWQDACLTMLDTGQVALVPIDTTENIYDTDAYDIQTIRVGSIDEHRARYMDVTVYNDRNGKTEKLRRAKTDTVAIQSPFYSVMNEPNSYFRRLVRAMNIMDTLDEDNATGKMNLIIQFPYSTRNSQHEKLAAKRKEEIMDQVANDPYGIVYLDATEKVTQLNRPIESNLIERVEYYQKQVYNQLCITEEIINGTASAEAMQNYMSRIIAPITNLFCLNMTRTFLTKNAITRGERIMAFYDPLSLVSIDNLADIADKLGRNEILSSNEFRSVIGRKPNKSDPRADELINKNINHPDEGKEPDQPAETLERKPENQNEQV